MTAFVSRWDTSFSGVSDINSIELPLVASGSYNFSVDWGDGTSDTITTWDAAAKRHTYSTSGEKIITITGPLQGWAFAQAGDCEKLIEVTSFGTGFVLGNDGQNFDGCSNLTSIAADLDCKDTSNFSSAWRNCSSLTNFPMLDTSNGTIFASAWRNCSSLTNFPLLDTSNGTNFYHAWSSCPSLTSFPLLNTSNGTSFSYTWSSCSSLTNFPLLNTSNGTSFTYAWFSCSSLTSFPLLDTSNGTSFSSAWRNCSSLTSFPLLDTSNGTDFSQAWTSCPINTADYSRLLISTAQKNANTGVTWQANLAKYTGEAVNARAHLVNILGWSITDAGVDPNYGTGGLPIGRIISGGV